MPERLAELLKGFSSSVCLPPVEYLHARLQVTGLTSAMRRWGKCVHAVLFVRRSHHWADQSGCWEFCFCDFSNISLSHVRVHSPHKSAPTSCLVCLLRLTEFLHFLFGTTVWVWNETSLAACAAAANEHLLCATTAEVEFRWVNNSAILHMFIWIVLLHTR